MKRISRKDGPASLGGYSGREVSRLLRSRPPGKWWYRIGIAAVVASLWCCARGADTNSLLTPSQMFEGGTNIYNNWVEFSTGGLITSGNRAEAQQLLQERRGAFGGIEDLHMQGSVATNLTLTLDGHSIFDDRDYRTSIRLEHPELWYLQFNAENFRTWYNGGGGFYPPSGQRYSFQDDALAVQRGQFSFEGGWTPKKSPSITFKYTHRYRDGEDNSTIWGPTHPDSGNTTLIRGLYPAAYGLNESADIFELDVRHHIKATQLALGLRVETGRVNDTANLTLFPGEPIQRDVTGRSDTSYDMVNVHASSETWISKKLFFSSGFMFENMDSTSSGSRNYGSDFDVGYAPDALNGLGYYSLNGGAHQQDYVMNLNLMSLPAKTLVIVPSLRVQQENWDSDSSGIGTLRSDSEPFSAHGNRGSLDVREAVDARYTRFTNWVIYARTEWTEGDGNLTERGGLSQIDGIGIAPINQHTEDSRLFQKYSAGATWYPLRRLSIDFGGYYKRNEYHYNNIFDSTPNDPGSVNRYPAFLDLQRFETYDGKLRVTLRPRQNITVVGRYEYQWSTVDTGPEPLSTLPTVQSSVMTTHIIAGNVSWVPCEPAVIAGGCGLCVERYQNPGGRFGGAEFGNRARICPGIAEFAK